MNLQIALLAFICAGGALSYAPTALAQDQTEPTALHDIHTVYVHSGTVYLKTEQMLNALRARPEFGAWKLGLVSDPQAAEVSIEVTRPFLTFDWVYKVTQQASGSVMATGKVKAVNGAEAAPRLAAEITADLQRSLAFAEAKPRSSAPLADTAPQQAATNQPIDPAQVARSFRTLYIRSGTIYLKNKVLQTALEQRPELRVWGIALVDTPGSADVLLDITRPFLTFDWNYKLLQASTGAVLAAGKVVAWDGDTAAPKLAGVIVEKLGTVRPGVAAFAEHKTELPAVSSKAGTSPSAPTARSRSWHVKYDSGTEAIKTGTEMKLTIGPEEIIAEAGRAVPFTIPLSAVAAVSYRRSMKRSPAGEAWWNFWTFGQALPEETIGQKLNKLSCSEQDCLGMLAMMPVLAGVGAVLEQFKTEQHFISIDFERDWNLRRVAFRVKGGDHKQLLQELQVATSKRWTDIPALLEKTRQELEVEKLNAMPVSFDRKVTVAFKELPAGLYHLVLLKREGSRGELYFFRGEQVNLDVLVAQALVEYDEQASALPLAQVTYREENGITTLAVVRTPQRILYFTAVPLAQQQEAAVLP